MDLKNIGSEGMQSINQVHKRRKVVRTYQYSTDPWDATGGKGLYDELIKCQLFKNVLAPCKQSIGEKIDATQIPLHVFTDLKMSLIIAGVFD